MAYELRGTPSHTFPTKESVKNNERSIISMKLVLILIPEWILVDSDIENSQYYIDKFIDFHCVVLLTSKIYKHHIGKIFQDNSI